MELIYKLSNVLMESLDLKEIAEKILNYIFHLFGRIDREVLILISLLTAFASRAALAIENALLYASPEKRGGEGASPNPSKFPDTGS